MTRKLSVLFLAADPVSNDNKARLALDEEIRLIRDSLRGTPLEHQIFIDSRWAVRPGDLLRTLNENIPDILHFSGHGTHTSELVLAGPDGTPRPVSVDALELLFSVFSGRVKVVLLNACYSEAQAFAIRRHVDAALGMNGTVGDEAARAFAASFYHAIGHGYSLQDSFKQACAGAALSGGTTSTRPILLSRQGVNPTAYYLLQKPQVDYTALGLALGSPVRLFFGSRQSKLRTLANMSIAITVMANMHDVSARGINDLLERFVGELEREIQSIEELYQALTGTRDHWSFLLDNVVLSKFAKLLQVLAMPLQFARQVRNFINSSLSELRTEGISEDRASELFRYVDRGNDMLIKTLIMYTQIVGNTYNELLDALSNEARAASSLARLEWSLSLSDEGPSIASI